MTGSPTIMQNQNLPSDHLDVDSDFMRSAFSSPERSVFVQIRKFHSLQALNHQLGFDDQRMLELVLVCSV